MKHTLLLHNSRDDKLILGSDHQDFVLDPFGLSCVEKKGGGSYQTGPGICPFTVIYMKYVKIYVIQCVGGGQLDWRFGIIGNICRSTIAEAIMLNLVANRGDSNKWIIDSAATADYNIGLPPDHRTMTTLKKNGINGYSHRARLLTAKDYDKFDIIFGMDEENMSDLEEMKPKKNCRAKLHMLGDWDPQKDRIIVDPYFTKGTAAFDKVFEQCMRCVTAFLNAPSS